MTIMATSIYVTGNYHTDLKSARALGIVTGTFPKADQLYDLIDNYNIKQMSESQKDREMALLDELINACNDSTESDTSDRSSLLPKPVLKRDRVSVPAPILKRDRIVTVDPLKRPTPRPVKLSDRKVTIAPKPKLSKPNRSLFQ
jgi:hypothetical protein